MTELIRHGCHSRTIARDTYMCGFIFVLELHTGHIVEALHTSGKILGSSRINSGARFLSIFTVAFGRLFYVS